MTEQNVRTALMVEASSTLSSCTAPYIDGADINRRYQKIAPSKRIRLDVQGWSCKPAVLYKSPKIMIRQAGVGIVATVDMSNAYCPQSVYIYRLKDEYAGQGYTHEFLLASLLSRTMAYYIFKRFGEIDPAKAHAKLTHDRLESLPVPRLDLSLSRHRHLHKDIVGNVRKLLSGEASLGGLEDGAIELSLRELWQVTPDDGAYINGQFYGLDNSQVVRDLFPKGPPKPQDMVVIR